MELSAWQEREPELARRCDGVVITICRSCIIQDTFDTFTEFLETSRHQQELKKQIYGGVDIAHKN